MYEIKNSIFLYLTKRQKAMLCTYLKNFTRLNKNLDVDEILNKFLEDEEYYNNIQNPHFYFVVENFENEEFILDVKKFIKSILKGIEYKEKQKPFLEKQKEYLKAQKKIIQENKMKSEKPTEKQLKYYTKLCKKYGIEQKNTQNASKFDLKNWISEILDKSDEILKNRFNIVEKN
ncbi:MAG: hypothetical protein E7Z91_04485 [Cyanobacteria bacterium SIG30]|nr:hypothetical protein [Cyanobacteria bacterium SIG30]